MDTRPEALRDFLAASYVHSSVPQAVLGPRGVIEDVNEALSRLFGFAREELLGRDVQDLLDPMESVAASIGAVFDDEGSTVARAHQLELVGRDARGRRLSLVVDVTVVVDRSGLQLGFGLFVKDVTELRDAQRRLERQEAFFHGLTRHATDVAVLCDAEGTLVYATPGLAELLGHTQSEVLATSGYDFVHPDDRAAALSLLESAVRDPTRAVRAVLRLQDVAGRWRHFEVTLTNCLEDPDIGGLVVNLRDITPAVQAHQALARSESRYRAIAETALEGLVIMAKDDGATIYANGRLAELLAVPLEDILEHGVLSALEPDLAARIHTNALRRTAAVPRRAHVTYRRPDGELRVFQISAREVAEEGGAAVLAMVADVTAERRAVEELRRTALHDPLTGLPNRMLLSDRLDLAVARRRRHPESLITMMFIDVDRLKCINDRAGHAVGDAVLVEVAARLRSAVRETDTVARVSGDEFVILCDAASQAEAAAIGQRVKAAFYEDVVVGSDSFRVTVSIGIATSPPGDPDELLRNADAAMYVVKEQSRDGVLLFDPEPGGPLRS